MKACAHLRNNFMAGSWQRHAMNLAELHIRHMQLKIHCLGSTSHMLQLSKVFMSWINISLSWLLQACRTAVMSDSWKTTLACASLSFHILFSKTSSIYNLPQRTFFANGSNPASLDGPHRLGWSRNTFVVFSTDQCCPKLLSPPFQPVHLQQWWCQIVHADKKIGNNWAVPCIQQDGTTLEILPHC